MSVKNCKQWSFEVPWGKLAMVSWGNTENLPVLCVHGFMDSAATFIPLIEMLPDSYYYVSIDFPGHGLSDPYPPGLLPSQLHLVNVIKTVVERMNWNRFIYMGHSMAYIIGIFYNAVYPHQISKMINIDPGPPVSSYWAQTVAAGLWIRFIYEDYYSHYDRYNTSQPRHYTYEQAISAVVRSRGLSEEQAEVVLSRCLTPVGDGKFKLSWDAKMKRVANALLPRESLRHIMSDNAPPTLNIISTKDIATEPGKTWAQKLMREVADMTPNMFTVFAEGGHDVHITNPKEVASQVTEFLKRDFSIVRSKI